MISMVPHGMMMMMEEDHIGRGNHHLQPLIDQTELLIQKVSDQKEG